MDAKINLLKFNFICNIWLCYKKNWKSIQLWNTIIIEILSLNMRSSMVSTLRVIAEVKQCWSAIGWVTKNLLSRTSPCIGGHVKPLVPAAFTAWVVSYSPFSLCVIHKESLCPSSGDINRLMMMMMMMMSINKQDEKP
jgi:hypothetical protein